VDKPIEKKPRSKQQWVVIGGLALAGLFVAWQVFSRSGTSRLRIDSTRITTGVVGQGTFREYYPFDGSVEPFTSVYLDIEEGGRVEKIYAEGGAHVEKGDLILRFSNAQAQRTSIETETRLLETLDTNRNTEFNSARASLLQQEALLDLDHEIIDVQAKFNRYDALMKTPDSPISKEQYETTRDQLDYLKHRRVLLKERMRQEEILSANQIAQAKKSIVRLNENMDLLNRIVQSLEVRAPISGYLSTIDAQVGQNINRGQRIGHVTLDGRSWDVKVQKVYPEVKNSLFEADIVFDGPVPTSLKRGQTVTVELSFGAPSQTLIVSKGGYYQQTGGRWVYLVSKDGRTAHRTDVKLGRQNPRQVEVLEGLTDGDRIITSGYDSYNNADELKFSEAIQTRQEKK
jgi:HlyD family secretion protein